MSNRMDDEQFILAQARATFTPTAADAERVLNATLATLATAPIEAASAPSHLAQQASSVTATSITSGGAAVIGTGMLKTLAISSALGLLCGAGGYFAFSHDEAINPLLNRASSTSTASATSTADAPVPSRRAAPHTAHRASTDIAKPTADSVVLHESTVAVGVEAAGTVEATTTRGAIDTIVQRHAASASTTHQSTAPERTTRSSTRSVAGGPNVEPPVSLDDLVPDDSATSLETEVLQMRRIERALREGSPALALRIVSDIERDIPNSRLTEERLAAAAIAHCMLHDARASEWHATFNRIYPRSAYATRIDNHCKAKR